jgi:Ni,Fe-hydrogenase III small subunit/Pyruvate/2-oxoacid:ferredoxin oxidoreductase delta subunit
MWRILTTRVSQGRRTAPFPGGDPGLPERFRGRPVIDPGRCRDGCRVCADACPTQALRADGPLELDLGRCVFCQECVLACPEGAISYTRDYRLAGTDRAGLVLRGDEVPRVRALAEKSRRLFGRSLKLREVCAGSCNGCEMELAALGNVVFDLGRFGVQFVASPRHADGLVVAGPVSGNMRQALLDTYEAVPSPRLVIAVGACAISGGPFRDSPETHNDVEGVVPVDLYVPGCPPHPLTILDGLLRLLGRLEDGRAGAPGSAPALSYAEGGAREL